MAELFDLPTSSLLSLAQVGLLRSYLRQRIVTEVLSQELLTEEDRQQALAAFVQEHQIGTHDELNQFRRDQLLTESSLTALAEEPLRLARYCERVYRPKAEARFLDRKTQLDRVVYSLMRFADEGFARELYLRLEEGEADFADLAATYSEGPERSTRGVVGPVPLTQAHQQLVERLRTAPAGVVQEPFQIENWWLVFRLESLMPAAFDDAMADQMSQELFEEWLEAEVSDKINALRPLVMTSGEGLEA